MAAIDEDELRAPINFREWSEVLERAGFPEAQRRRYWLDIVGFLKRCKDRKAPATVAFIREHLSEVRGARAALQWFYREARKRGKSGQGPRTRDQGPGTGTQGREGAAASKLVQREAGVPPPAQRSERRSDVRPPAASDMGGADWERDLIKAVRERGFLWRTEQTYREWGARFAQFLKPRSPYAATEAEVGAFLSDLAVRQGVRPSTQKQAA